MACWFAENSAMTKENVDYSGNKEVIPKSCMILHNLYATCNAGGYMDSINVEKGDEWLAMLVERLLATAALWVRI